MNKAIQNLNQNQIVSGVALVSTAALSVYTVKSTIELNKKIDEIYEDLNKIKNYVSENQRKNNINTAALGKKIEEIHGKFNSFTPPTTNEYYVDERPLQRKIVPVKEEDEVDNAVSNFLEN